MREISAMTKIIESLALAAAMLAAAAAFRLGEAAHLFGGDVADRGMQVIIGLVLAYYGNAMPKAVGDTRAAPCAGGRTQAVLRFGGWTFTLAGVGYAALWALAPRGFAGPASTALVASAAAVAIVHLGWVVLSCRRAERSL